MKYKNYILQLPAFLILISYPFLVHNNIIESSMVPFAVVLMLVSFAVMIKYWITAIIISVLLVISALLMYGELVVSLYFLPPIVINYFVGMLFLSSLTKNRIPLIEKYKTILEGEITQEERLYARKITIAWAVLLMILAIESVVLSLFFSHEVWSIFTNCINYILLGMMFVVEYVVRLRMFPGKKHMSFIEFIMRLKSIKLKSVLM